MHFQLTSEEHQKINTWIRTEVYPEIAEKQKAQGGFIASMVLEDEQGPIPYFGAVGGSVAYEFIPTSLGTITRAVVDYDGKKYVLDLTDYGNW